ncbi:MAG: AraC family transcriptional regulator [Oscillospiraceae bacterium]|nr:AraC family transcriptional regulator [Oscillospiraceae bacterium]
MDTNVKISYNKLIIATFLCAENKKGGVTLVQRDFELTVDNARVLFQFNPNFLNHRYVWNPPRHSNVNYELHIILHGSCVVEVAEDTISLSAGDALIIAPGVYHAAKVDNGSFERFTITFATPKSALAPRLQTVIAPYVRMTAPPEIRSLCNAMMREYGSEALYTETLLHFQLGQLLVFLLRQLSALEKHAQKNETNTGRNGSKDTTEMVTAIEAFFTKNMASYGVMQQLADRLHMSKRQLCRLIPELYGMTFREKLLDTRMDYAAWLLRTTQQTTSEICKQVGYSSEPTFYTNFKQHHGISPAQYRRKYQTVNITETETSTATKGRDQL